MNESLLTHDLTLANPLDHIDREWLITNGTGAFAMGTVPGVNTRRYHGLFVAAGKPPVARVVALNQVLEQIFIPDETPGTPGTSGKLEFTTCEFKGGAGEDVFVPGGYTTLRRFRRGSAVSWLHETAPGGVTLEKELHLHWKQQAATLFYRVSLPAGVKPGAKLRLAPMVTLRDFHAVVRSGAASPSIVSQKPDAITLRQGDVVVTIATPGAEGATFVPSTSGGWWFGVHYRIDAERGQEHLEDYHVPGAFEFDLTGKRELRVALTVALGERAAEPCDDQDRARAAHLGPIMKRLAPAAEAAATLGPFARVAAPAFGIASDDFIVDRHFRGEKLATVLAGFPWFADWGRDTFIALPGLLLTTGRFEEARSCLKTFASNLRDGLVPNVFSDYDDTLASYNTVDASLWYVHAAMEYVKASGDRESWRDWLANACNTIIEAYIKGTKHDIRVAGDGLVTAGGPDTQLTWMDACCDGVCFTPRHGKAVEINALWHHVLVGMSELLASADPPDKARSQHYAKLASRIGRAFPKVFWDEKRNCCFDHVWIDGEGNEHRDAAMRPNQIFVASLEHSPLPRTRLTQIVQAVRAKLLTPYGLRTLAEDDANYHPAYTGPQRQRDEAYHQGTIWPWLIGPYAEAVLRVGKFSPKAKTEAKSMLTPLVEFMLHRGQGQLYEIHEASAPYRPVGTMAQAWSVSEVIRVLSLCA